MKTLACLVAIICGGVVQAQETVYEFHCSGGMTMHCTVEQHTYTQDYAAVASIVESQRSQENTQFNWLMNQMRKEGNTWCRGNARCLTQLQNLLVYDRMTEEHPILKNAVHRKFVNVYTAYGPGSADVLQNDKTSLQHCINAPNEDDFSQCVERVDGARKAEIKSATRPKKK